MRTHLHRWLPTVIALLALVIALDGPAAAKRLIDGKDIKKGTVASKQIKNKTVKSNDIKDGGVRGVDVLDFSLTGPDLAFGSIDQGHLAAGSVTGAALDSAGTVFLNFGSIAANDCANMSLGSIPTQDGNLSDDVIIATPDAFFGGDFAFTVKSEGSVIPYVKMCNVGASTADPDSGGGGTWRYVAIDITS
jgi:hypothetical protein